MASQTVTLKDGTQIHVRATGKKVSLYAQFSTFVHALDFASDLLQAAGLPAKVDAAEHGFRAVVEMQLVDAVATGLTLLIQRAEAGEEVAA